jgi:hypothetical protein
MNGLAVPITPFVADARLEHFADIDALPQDCDGLLGAAAAHSFFLGRPWWRCMQQAGLPPGAVPRYVLCRLAGAPAALFPLLAAGNGAATSGLTNPYSCLYQPLLAPGLAAPALVAVGAAFARFCRAGAAVRLDGLPADMAGLAPLLAGLRQGGVRPESFAAFGNWHACVAGLGWEAYLAARPGELRTTIGRKLRRGETMCRIVADVAGLDAGIAAYDAVYARSWKQAEPYPDFTARMMRHAAEAGVLRLGLLLAGDVPIAAQIWIVANRQACVVKLAHDAAFKALSPGTVLTAQMIRHMLTHEAVDELDFGRGDDAYKALWVDRRRQRIGLLLLNWRRPHGLVLLARQSLARARARLRQAG